MSKPSISSILKKLENNKKPDEENPTVWSTERGDEGSRAVGGESAVTPTRLPEGTAGRLRGRGPKPPEPGGRFSTGNGEGGKE